MGAGEALGTCPGGGAPRSSGFSDSDIAQLYGFAVIATFACLIAFGFILILRAGMGDNIAALGMLFVLTILPPWCCAWSASRFAGSAGGAACAGTVGLFTGILLPVACLVVGSVIVAVSGLFVLFAIWSGRGPLRKLSAAKALTALAVLIAAILLIIFTMPLRIYLPEALLLGVAWPDSYYHIALAQMVAHHGIFSIGADGLVYNHYHFLSHFLAAGLSQGSGLTVPQIYLYWGTVALKLDCTAAFFFAGVFLYRDGNASAPTKTFWLLLYAWLAACLVAEFESESFMLGLALINAALPLLLVLTTPARGTALPFAIAGIVAVLLCTAAKVSCGFFGVIALVVAAWHHRAKPLVTATLLGGTLLVAYVALLYVMPRSHALADASPIVMLGAYLQILTWQTLASYALLLVVIITLVLRIEATYGIVDGGAQVRFRTTRAVTSETPHRLVRWLLAADGTTQFLLLSFIACLGVLLAVRIGSDAVYFSLHLYSFALILLPMALGMNSNIALTDRPLRWFVAILLLINVLPRFGDFTSNTREVLISLRRAALSLPEGRSSGLFGAIQASLRAHKMPFAGLHREIVDSPRSRFIAELERVKLAAGGKLAVQIAPSADMWYYLRNKDSIWCTMGHLVVPAETGIPEIRSVAPNVIERQCMPLNVFWYGYDNTQESRRTTILSDAQLCALAAPLKVRQVYRLVSYIDLKRNTLVSCP